MKVVSESDAGKVVDVALLVPALAFFLVDDPVVAIDDVLVEVVSLRQADSGEPLARNVVELHPVPLLPVVE